MHAIRQMGRGLPAALGVPALRGKLPQTKGKRRLIMGNCSCAGRQKADNKEVPKGEKKVYICPRCKTFTATPSGEPAPECCGKKMLVLE
jgi:hypothetical protein